ncbi:Uncharacterised protein [uncultured archaeon]|nr:Uncharacterised protein [uncultured archaeon]
MPCEESGSTVAVELSHAIGIPEDELIHRGLISFIEKEIRLAEMDIADLRDRYNAASKEELYEAIKSKKIPTHPACEDYIVWKNKEKYIADLKARLVRV